MRTVRDGDHLDVDAVYRGARDRLGQVTLQTVYDSLHALHRAGLVRKI
jgi:Fe2+ or Zn2+ uptake regulation protein